MTQPFLISDDHLRALSATRQGRVSIAGYNYQAAYAVARLAAMSVRQPVLDLKDWPRQIRYDWGEDLDEVCDDGTVIFTQCKRVDDIGQPASLAEILAGFAPKWLWTPASERGRLRFRMVCSDRRFSADGAGLDSAKADVRSHFLAGLEKPAAPRSDRALWIAEAEAAGHETLFEALWDRFECVYLRADVVDAEPAGPRLAAEKEALRVLLERGRIDPSWQTEVLGRLRRTVHDNLITFDPADQSLLPPFNLSPRWLDRADVNAAIEPWRPATQRRPPFQLVDRTFLSEQRELERRQFVARQPDWCDVAHGYDETIKFIERDQTAALEATVTHKVVARIGRAAKLPALFVAGAPGDGKTTITRRVAARLVDAGAVLIADTGVGLHDPPGEPDEYVQAVERLQSFGRPVVLLLDDPLYAESPWLDVLKKLNRPGLQVGVLAATPQFLLHEHRAQLSWACDLETFEMARTSQQERESLATLYGRSVPSQAGEDFLVVAMEAAIGHPFSQIIERLWATLVDGRDLSSARSLSHLPWQARAYLFVCFFSRAYEACPEPLLLKLLEMTGGVPSTSDVRLELQRMRHFDGWRIFRIGSRAKAAWEYQGAPITTAHTVIARQAWEQRPVPWVEVGGEIIAASVSVPEAIRDVARLAVQLNLSSPARLAAGTNGDDFTGKLIERWKHTPDVQTRYVCDLVSTFTTSGCAELVRPICETLIKRATPDSQGWLAAHLLSYMYYHLEKQTGFPPGLDISLLIQAADFSVAPWRAVKFAQRLKHEKALRDAFVARLLDALEGKLEWSLRSFLLTYLLAAATPKELLPHISRVTAWLERNSHDSHVRTQYLSFLLRLPAEFSNLREEAARQTAEWLKQHDDDRGVRTKFLSFLLRLPTEFSQLRAEVAWQTAEWLKQHSEDTYVRTQYLSFLTWLPDEFSPLRAEAARWTAEWLREHDEDRSVRAQYLSFLLRLPAEFSNLWAEAARRTAEWLKQHDDDMYVRSQYLPFLSQIPYTRTSADGTIQVDEWQRLGTDALEAAVNIVVQAGWQKQHHSLIRSFFSIHQELLWSLRLYDSEGVRRVLQASHETADEWFEKNSPFETRPYLPLP